MELLQWAEWFLELVQTRLREELFRWTPELQSLARPRRLVQVFPTQVPLLFPQTRNFPQRIQRHLPLAAQFQLPQQLPLPRLVFLRPSFSPASRAEAAVFWRCPSGHRQIPAQRQNESANANQPARASVPASGRQPATRLVRWASVWKRPGLQPPVRRARAFPLRARR